MNLFFYNCGGLARNLTVFEHFCHVEAVSCCCRSSHSIAMFFAELVEPAAGVRTLFSSFFFERVRMLIVAVWQMEWLYQVTLKQRRMCILCNNAGPPDGKKGHQAIKPQAAAKSCTTYRALRSFFRCRDVRRASASATATTMASGHQSETDIRSLYMLYLGLSPFPVTVTIRIFTCLVRNSYKPSVAGQPKLYDKRVPSLF